MMSLKLFIHNSQQVQIFFCRYTLHYNIHTNGIVGVHQKEWKNSDKCQQIRARGKSSFFESARFATCQSNIPFWLPEIRDACHTRHWQHGLAVQITRWWRQSKYKTRTKFTVPPMQIKPTQLSRSNRICSLYTQWGCRLIKTMWSLLRLSYVSSRINHGRVTQVQIKILIASMVGWGSFPANWQTARAPTAYIYLYMMPKPHDHIR